MTFLVGLIRVVLVLVVIRFVLRAVAAFLRPRSRPPAEAAAETPALAGDMVRDRICNTFVLKERAVRALVAGREESFCSALCRDKALATVSRAG